MRAFAAYCSIEGRTSEPGWLAAAAAALRHRGGGMSAPMPSAPRRASEASACP